MGIESAANKFLKNFTKPTLKEDAEPINPKNDIVWNSDRAEGRKDIPTTSTIGRQKSKTSTDDRRVRLTMKSIAAWNKLFGLPGLDSVATSNLVDEGVLAGHLLAPLHPTYGLTNGLIFPYTPVINYNYMADWSPQALTHTNYQTESYNRSYIDSLTVTGQFTAQDVDEARYSLAAIHFFRTITKMYYGINDGALAGTPPPTLLFSGHGDMMFNNVPVIVKSFLHDMLPDVDYVEVETKNGSAWIPTVFNISITLGIQHNMIKVRNEFSLNEFASGRLLGGKGGYL